MIVIRGWVDHPDFSFRCKCGDNLTPQQAVMLINAVKDGPAFGRIRLPGGTILEYNRYPSGRIAIKQI